MQNSKAYIWGLLSRFAPQGIYLLTTMVLARFVSPDAFGTIGVLSVIFVVANILIDSGLGGSLIKEKDISQLDCSTINIFNLAVSLILYVIIFSLSGYIQNYFGIEGLANIVKVIGVLFPITAFGVVPLSLLKRTLQFSKIFLSMLCGVLISSVISIVIAINGGDVYSLVAYQIIVNLVNVVLNIIFSKYRFSFQFSMSSLKRLIPFGFYTSIVTIVDSVYENIMTILTGKYLNVQTAGYLYQAKRLEETTSYSVAMAVGIVAFPILTKFKDDLTRFKSECMMTYNTISLLFFPLITLVSIFSKEVLVLLFGQQWEASAPFLRVLMICGVFIMTEQLLFSFIKSLGRVKNFMYLTLVKRGIGLLLMFITLVYDAEFLIYTYLLTTIIGCLINAFLFSRVVNDSIAICLGTIIHNILPSAFLYCFCIALGFLFNCSYICMLVFISLYLSVYYLFYLRLRGVDVHGFVKHIF